MSLLRPPLLQTAISKASLKAICYIYGQYEWFDLTMPKNEFEVDGAMLLYVQKKNDIMILPLQMCRTLHPTLDIGCNTVQSEL